MKIMGKKLLRKSLAMMLLILLLAMGGCSGKSSGTGNGASGSDDSVQLRDDEDFTDEIADAYVNTLTKYIQEEGAPDSSHLIIVRSTDLSFYIINYYCYCYDDTGAYIGIVGADLYKNSQGAEQHRDAVGDGTAIVGNGYVSSKWDFGHLPFIGTDYNTVLSKIGNATNFFGDTSSFRIDCPNANPVFNVDIKADAITPIEHHNAVPGENDYLLTVREYKNLKGESCALTTDYTFDPNTLELTSMVESYEFGPEVNVLYNVNWDTLNERRLQNGVCGYFKIYDDVSVRTVKIAYNKNYFNEFAPYTSYAEIKAHFNPAYIICDTYENGKQD